MDKTAMMNSKLTADEDALIKVLAELLADNDNHECFVSDVRLKLQLSLAQEMFNIKGGCRPSVKFVLNIKKYLKDIKNNADWHQKFVKKYYKR